jgi:hypothetical protein
LAKFQVPCCGIRCRPCTWRCHGGQPDAISNEQKFVAARNDGAHATAANAWRFATGRAQHDSTRDNE